MSEDIWFYRYEARRYSVIIDADMDLYGTSNAALILEKYKLHSETPKGHWIGIFGGKEKWVSKTSRKRFAHPSEEEALKSYIQRKKAYVRHAKAKLDRANEDLEIAAEGNEY